jgi:glycosyltransferase involved in cell wall biosynthesis
MKILYVCHQFFPSHYTGTERYTLEIAKQAQRMGHSATVLTYSVEKLGPELASTEGVTLNVYDFEGVPVVALLHNDFDERGGWSGVSIDPTDPIIYRAVDQFLRQNIFDIVHCVHPMRLGSIVKAAHSRGLKVVLTLMDYWLLCPRGTLLRVDGAICDGPDEGRSCVSLCFQSEAIERIISRYKNAGELLDMADVVLSHSQFLIDLFQNNGVDTSKFLNLRNGMNYSVIPQTRSMTPKEQRSTINIGFLGTLLPHKGAHVLIEAFRNIPQNNVRLKLFGNHFGMHDYYSHLVTLAGGDPRIEFCGEYDFGNLGTLIQQIDIVVVPSVWFENAPLVISTAQMFGVPVIASRMGGMSEMVVDGVNGLTFTPGDVVDLTAKIDLAIKNPVMLRELAKKRSIPPRIESEGFLLERLYDSIVFGCGAPSGSKLVIGEVESSAHPNAEQLGWVQSFKIH